MKNKKTLSCQVCEKKYFGHYNTKFCFSCRKICRYCDRKIEDGSRGNICSSCRNKKYKYSLTEEEMYKWLEADKCDCCGGNFKNHRDKSQDHNHDTGANRGIVCQNCNIFIGFVENNNLEDVINYLIKYDEGNR